MKQEDRNQVDHLKDLHYKMRDLLNQQNFKDAKLLLEEYSNEDSDINEMYTLKIITKPFKDHVTLKESRKRLLDMIEQKLDKKLI